MITLIVRIADSAGETVIVDMLPEHRQFVDIRVSFSSSTTLFPHRSDRRCQFAMFMARSTLFNSFIIVNYQAHNRFGLNYAPDRSTFGLIPSYTRLIAQPLRVSLHGACTATKPIYIDPVEFSGGLFMNVVAPIVA